MTSKINNEYIARLGTKRFILTILEQELEGLKHDDHGIEAFEHDVDKGTISFFVGEGKERWQLTLKKL